MGWDQVGYVKVNQDIISVTFIYHVTETPEAVRVSYSKSDGKYQAAGDCFCNHSEKV